jgi:hypothetical protein
LFSSTSSSAPPPKLSVVRTPWFHQVFRPVVTTKHQRARHCRRVIPQQIIISTTGKRQRPQRTKVPQNVGPVITTEYQTANASHCRNWTNLHPQNHQSSNWSMSRHSQKHRRPLRPNISDIDRPQIGKYVGPGIAAKDQRPHRARTRQQNVIITTKT